MKKKELKKQIKELKKLNKELVEQKRKSYDSAIEHNNMLEILFQMQGFRNDLQVLIDTYESRKLTVENHMKIFERNYPKCKSYIDDLKNRDVKDVGTISSKYSI